MASRVAILRATHSTCSFSILADCGIPRPPMNGNMVYYSGTRVGNTVTYACNNGYRPSSEMTGTCTMDSMWDPTPERHHCSLVTSYLANSYCNLAMFNLFSWSFNKN